MSDRPQKVVWTGEETNEEWDLKHEQEEAYIVALSQTLRPCPQHGNPAVLEDEYEGSLIILANPCGCWLKMEFYDSVEEMVDVWNDQPQVDCLLAEIDALTRGAAPNADDLFREIAELRQTNIELMARLDALRSMPLYRRVEIVDGESAEPVCVVGVHPLQWRGGEMPRVSEPTYAFARVEWETPTDE